VQVGDAAPRDLRWLERHADALGRTSSLDEVPASGEAASKVRTLADSSGRIDVCPLLSAVLRMSPHDFELLILGVASGAIRRDEAELVAAASFVEMYGIDLGRFLGSSRRSSATSLNAAWGDLDLDVDGLLWAAASFGIVPRDALVAWARESEGRFEPAEDDWRERGGHGSSGGDISEIDWLFGTLS
jgi:hypothetical protein